ncbi:MAG: hypothetical protein OXF31_11290 [Gammaproteobacteria bacterium]|nr:hypothetical protein [Gammaproteobacteria bacterium]
MSNEEANGGCLQSGINLTSSATIPNNTEVRYLVSTKQGYNHFRNHGVAVFLSSAEAFIRGNDLCQLPGANAANNNVVYRFRNGNMNDSCVCMSKSSVVAAGIADGESESYATTALNWRTDSTDYCPESPYQRPGG